METVTATIKREWLAEIISGRKKIEYRPMTDFWYAKLVKAGEVPFALRLINGMKANAPEATVKVVKVLLDLHAGQYELHLGKIIDVQHWEPGPSDSTRHLQQPSTSDRPARVSGDGAPAFKVNVAPADIAALGGGKTAHIVVDNIDPLADQVAEVESLPYVIDLTDGANVQRAIVRSDYLVFFGNYFEFVLEPLHKS